MAHDLVTQGVYRYGVTFLVSTELLTDRPAWKAYKGVIRKSMSEECATKGYALYGELAFVELPPDMVLDVPLPPGMERWRAYGFCRPLRAAVPQPTMFG